MEAIRIAIELILKIMNIFTGKQKKQEDIEKAVKQATSVYEQTTDIPSDVRESHQKVKSKLRQAWEARWGSMKTEEPSE